MELDIIVNPKTTDDGQAVIQLETAAGDAIKHFNNAHGVNVPRSRFLPVKSCSDLLLIKSDIYSLEHGQLIINPQRMFETTPVIKLGDHFKKIAQFQKRFKKIPKIIELDHLTVTGDVYFGRNVTLRGTVIVVANEGQRIDIPDGCVLENRLLSGNLNMIVRPLLLVVCCGGTHRRGHAGTMIAPVLNIPLACRVRFAFCLAFSSITHDGRSPTLHTCLFCPAPIAILPSSFTSPGDLRSPRMLSRQLYHRFPIHDLRSLFPLPLPFSPSPASSFVIVIGIVIVI